MPGLSRPKDGVLLHAYVPAAWALLHNLAAIYFSNSQAQTAVRHHPYCLARPRVGPSSHCLPSKRRGMARQVARPLFFVCPHLLSEIRGASRRATQTACAVRAYLRRLPYGAGPRFSWPPVKHGTAAVSQLLAGGSYWPPGGAPAPPGCVLCEARPRAPHPIPPRMTPHESAPRWTGWIGLYSI
jgi:hypothetical protein